MVLPQLLNIVGKLILNLPFDLLLKIAYGNNSKNILYNTNTHITQTYVAIYVENGIAHELAETMSEESNEMETVGISITDTNQGHTKVVCIYRAPDNKLCNFNAKMEQIRYKLRKKRAYLCGYYNIDLVKVSEHQDTKDFLDGMLCRSHSYYECVPRVDHRSLKHSKHILHWRLSDSGHSSTHAKSVSNLVSSRTTIFTGDCMSCRFHIERLITFAKITEN